jgi:ribosomal protein L11 methyltransferase
MVPYDKLYIYEIDGAISLKDNELPPEYIGTWCEGEHAFIFFSQDRKEVIESLIKANRGLHLVDQFTMNYYDWQAGDEITSFRVGNMIFVPPWEKASLLANEIPIRLDPSVVFGTGFHPTTRACLEALWELYQKSRPRVVSDLGTGTGILALACAKLGAEEVLAVDHNPLAVKTANRNVTLNGENRRIRVVEGKAEIFVSERADLICCNLPYLVFDQLLESKAFYEKQRWILSGFFEKDGERIIQRLERKGVNIQILPSPGPWQTLVGLRPLDFI